MAKHNEDDMNDIDLEATGEDNVDETELEATEAGVNDKLKDLRTKLKTCEAEKMEHLEQLQRAKAEFLNARKRMETEKVEAKERAVDGLIEKLLPMHDSFTAAMDNEDSWNAVDKSWRKGVEAIYSQLTNLMQSYDVAAVNPTGQLFDPEHHEAMGYEPVNDEAQHDTIVKVLQVGFVRGNGNTARTIRPARVIVGNVSNTTD
jgi:molecular chaperone GrpE